EDVITAKGADAIRVSYPMLVFDGKDRTKVAMDKNAVKLTLAGKSVKFTVLEPSGVTLRRNDKQLKHRNGMVAEAFAETTGKRLVYRITAK
ncbi:MAG: hypothetical protein GY794_01910, partial [bacterium]|nr:hypothetical protein [bacterium]